MSLNRAEFKKQLLNGEYSKVEKQIFEEKKEEAARELQELINEVTVKKEGYNIASKLRRENGFGDLRKLKILIKTAYGEQIKVYSWYSTKKAKKRGRKKKGPNGRGAHLLLKYWGFQGKDSPNYVMHVARTGIGCESYDLATKELQAQGMSISHKGVNEITKRVGEFACLNRDHIDTEKNDDLTGKRVQITIDGGRVRIIEKKVGRYKLKQKRSKFNANWREPKLVVINLLDDKGQKLKGSKPIYEATLEDHHELFRLIDNLAEKFNLKDAKEIVLSGDGASWIWNKYEEFTNKFKIKAKTTEILDWFHAIEHLNNLAEEGITEKKEKKKWIDNTKNLLKTGNFREFINQINLILEQTNNQEKKKIIKREKNYFQKNKSRLKYNEYEKNNQPIGSGIVESAIRRVINLRLKAPGRFWKKENLEKILKLRCILMSGRWKIFKKNFIKSISLKNFTVY